MLSVQDLVIDSSNIVLGQTCGVCRFYIDLESEVVLTALSHRNGHYSDCAAKTKLVHASLCAALVTGKLVDPGSCPGILQISSLLLIMMISSLQISDITPRLLRLPIFCSSAKFERLSLLRFIYTQYLASGYLAPINQVDSNFSARPNTPDTSAILWIMRSTFNSFTIVFGVLRSCCA